MKKYKTQALLMIDVEHWHTPQDVANMLRDILKYPTVTNVAILGAASNYCVHGEPLPTMMPVMVK